jgi:pectinesterase
MRIALICALLSASIAGHAQTLLVTVKNSAPIARPHETIALAREKVAEVVGEIDPARLKVCQVGREKPLPVQVTGKEVLFQCDIAARDKMRFAVTMSAHREQPQASLVSGMFFPPREDYAWENDRIAFRMYGPALAAEVNNGIDVWSKRVRYPIVAKWYKESESGQMGKDSYHMDRGEGADYFSVGRSLGAGALGLWKEGRVLQPGVFASWKTITNGPIRVSFALTYKWLFEGDSLTEEKTISLDAGENLNRIEVRFSGPHAGKPLPIVCGLVKRANTVVTHNQEKLLLSLWGPTTDDPLAGSLGTAIVVPSPNRMDFAEIIDQHLMVGETSIGSTFVYYAGAGWTGNGVFRKAADWESYLADFTARQRSPLDITYSKAK